MITIKDRAHMSIGNSFSVQVLSDEASSSQWYSGNGYTYGMLPPRYPVPAVLSFWDISKIDWIDRGYKDAQDKDDSLGTITVGELLDMIPGKR